VCANPDRIPVEAEKSRSASSAPDVGNAVSQEVGYASSGRPASLLRALRWARQPVHGRRRPWPFFWPVLASAILNVFAWSAFLTYLSLQNHAPDETRELVLSSSPIRIEHRAQRKPKVSARGRAAAASSQSPAVKLPAGWDKQDFGYVDLNDATVYLDWTKQSKNFVSHVIVTTLKDSDGDVKVGSLQAAVRERLDGLRAGAATVNVSEPARICHGRRPGWFFSYTKLWDDPPLHFDESLFITNGAVHMVVYMRAADQPEDRRTLKALKNLCKEP
jgi:hypothetical protein